MNTIIPPFRGGMYKYFAWLLFSAKAVYSEIAPIHYFHEAKHEIEKADSDSLVLFDVDEVLILPKDLSFRQNLNSHKELWKKLWQEVGFQEADHLVSIILSQIEYILVDAHFPSFLQAIQKKGIKTLGLTAARTGKFGMIENAEDWRIGQLKEFSINFHSPLPTHEFPHLVKEGKNAPIFKSGILFLGDLFDPEKSMKGVLLSTFFDKIKWTPKKVFFFDDNLDNVKAVEEEMKKRGIPFQGYHFKGADLVEGKLNETVARLQFRHLFDKKEWLSDEQCALLLNKLQ